MGESGNERVGRDKRSALRRAMQAGSVSIPNLASSSVSLRVTKKGALAGRPP